jgi:hypothetical protein
MEIELRNGLTLEIQPFLYLLQLKTLTQAHCALLANLKDFLVPNSFELKMNI